MGIVDNLPEATIFMKGFGVNVLSHTHVPSDDRKRRTQFVAGDAEELVLASLKNFLLGHIFDDDCCAEDAVIVKHRRDIHIVECSAARSLETSEHSKMC